MKFNKSIFYFVLLTGMLCALCPEVWAFGRMDGVRPTFFESFCDAFKMVFAGTAVFTGFAVFLKRIFYQGMFNDNTFGYWIVAHAMMVGIVSVAYAFFRPQLGSAFNRWFNGMATIEASAWIVYSLPIMLTLFSFFSMYFLEHKFLVQEKKNGLTFFMKGSLVAANLFYASMLILMAELSGNVMGS